MLPSRICSARASRLCHATSIEISIEMMWSHMAAACASWRSRSERRGESRWWRQRVEKEGGSNDAT